jgi:hypothetical protein
MPPERRISFLRLAMFDSIVWSLDRSFGDLVFCDNPKHPVVCYGNGLSIPCPKVLGNRYLQSGAGDYADIPGSPVQALPMMWNDIMTMLAVRGGEEELADCEKIGQSIAFRMKGDRGTELARALIERGLSSLQVAGVLSRIWILATNARDVAKDPYYAAKYYAGMVQGSGGDKGVESFVSQSMEKAVLGGFDFAKEMKSKGKDDDHPG